MRTGAPVTRNVGGLDRGLRWIAAIVLLAIAFFVDLAGVWRMLAFLIGTATAFTALLRYCPINAAIGVNTLAPKS
jgi:hypothetical protein